ncbi:MAG: ParB/RepB/Spo0J family partition protein [Actinomycetota bacterium]
MNEKRRGLGRGLGALIQPSSQTQDRPVDVLFQDAQPSSGVSTNSGVPRGTPEFVDTPGVIYEELLVDSIRPNSRQPRTIFDEDELDELSNSIKQIGVLQPVIVRSLGAASYELIMGERRWRAAIRAGLEAIPAIIRKTDDDNLLRDALLENLHRSSLNPLEEAAAYQQMLEDFGCTHEELASRISRSRPQITNTIRLLKLPPLVQRRVASGIISAGHAKALLTLSDGALIERLAQKVVAEGLSVRALEEISATYKNSSSSQKREPKAGSRQPELDDLAKKLSDHFETRVLVSLGKKKGKLSVEFASVEDLRRILATMVPGSSLFGPSQ